MIKSQILSARDNINSWYHINETSYRDLLEKYDIKLLPVISIKRNEKRLTEQAIKEGYKLKGDDVFLDMSLVLHPSPKLFEPTKTKNIYKVLKNGTEIVVSKNEYLLLYGIINNII